MKYPKHRSAPRAALPRSSARLTIDTLEGRLVPTFDFLQATQSGDFPVAGVSGSDDAARITFISTADLTGQHPGTTPDVFLYDTQSRDLVQVSTANTPTQAVTQAEISGDGNLIVFSGAVDPIGENPDGNAEIFLFDIAQNSVTQITNTQGSEMFNISPTISADRRWVGFQSRHDFTGANQDQNSEIFLYETTTSTFQQVTDSERFASYDSVQISGDGRFLAFHGLGDPIEQNADGNRELFLFDRASQSTRQLTNLPFVDLPPSTFSERISISRDGQRIALTSTGDLTGQNLDGSEEVFLFDVPSDTFSQISNFAAPTAVNRDPIISPDGTTLIFTSNANMTGENGDGTEEVFLFDIAGNRLTQVTDSATRGSFAGAIAAGGERIAIISRGDFEGRNPLNDPEVFIGVPRGVDPPPDDLVRVGFDFGDAPDKYATLLASGGPRHVTVGPTLGVVRDKEADGQPGGFADLDDFTPFGKANDEDGVIDIGNPFSNPFTLFHGSEAFVSVSVAGAAKGAFLSGWIDFNGDGVFDLSERILDRVPVVNGVNDFSFDVPSTGFDKTAFPSFVPRAVDSFARFRLSTNANAIAAPTGAAPDGEVEDYLVRIAPADFGDAPESYGTQLIDNGPRHITTGPQLGSIRDAESDAITPLDGRSDDASPAPADNAAAINDDEDGVVISNDFVLMAGSREQAVVTVTFGSAFLYGWVDFNGDGDFEDAGEQILDEFPVDTGTQVIEFDVPDTGYTGISYARFRLSTERDLGLRGIAGDGEVEDYQIRINPARSLDPLVVGAGTGGSEVRVFAADGGQLSSVTPFNPIDVPGGIRVASSDFSGDGEPELVVGPGPGGPPLVKVLDGATQWEVRSFPVFESSFTGGVYIATGDVNQDGVDDIIVTPDQGGGPRIRIFSGADGSQLQDFFGIEDANFRGGARAVLTDVNGDRRPDLIVAAGFGGGPRVAIFDGLSLTSANPTKLIGDFFVFEPSLRNGVFLAGGDITGDGQSELIAAGGPGGGPRILILDGAEISAGRVTAEILDPVANFFAGDPSTRGGIRVTAKDLDGDRFADLVSGAGPGVRPEVTRFSGQELSRGNPARIDSFLAFDPEFVGGIFVG